MAANETGQAKDSGGFIEYLGDTSNPQSHGVTFLTSHTIPKGDGLWKRNKVDDAKEVTWERDPQGPAIGQRGNRMLVSVEDLTPSMVAVLEKTPGYKRVSE